MSKKRAPGMCAASYSARASRPSAGRYQLASRMRRSGALRCAASQSVETRSCGSLVPMGTPARCGAGPSHSGERPGGARPAAAASVRFRRSRRMSRKACPKRSIFCGPMPGMRSSAVEVAGPDLGDRASVAGVQPSGLPSPSGAAGERHLRGVQPVEERALRAVRRAGGGRGATGARRRAGEHLEEARAEALELDRADAGDAGERVEGLRAGGSPSRSACGRGR